MAIHSEQQLWDFWNTQVSPSEKTGFLASFGIHAVQLQQGTELYKYSQHDPYNATRGVWSPWWHFRRATVLSLTGGRSFTTPSLAGHLSTAESMNVSDTRLARVRSSVKDEWNDLTGLWIIRLTTAAWGLFGRNSGLGKSDTDLAAAKVSYIGGAYQIYIPKLARSEATVVSTSYALETGKA